MQREATPVLSVDYITVYSRPLVKKQPRGDKDGEFRGQKCHRDISHLASVQIRQKCNQQVRSVISSVIIFRPCIQADGQITERWTGRTLLSGYPVFSVSMFILRSSRRRLRERSGIATRRDTRSAGMRWIFIFVHGQKCLSHSRTLLIFVPLLSSRQ